MGIFAVADPHAKKGRCKAQTPQGPVDEGAARLAAIDKTRFEVAHFLRKADIQADPAGVERVFPKALAEDIRTRAAR